MAFGALRRPDTAKLAKLPRIASIFSGKAIAGWCRCCPLEAKASAVRRYCRIATLLPVGLAGILAHLLFEFRHTLNSW